MLHPDRLPFRPGLFTGRLSDGLALAHAVQESFIHALASGMWLATGIALLGVVIAAVTIKDGVGQSEAIAQPAREQARPEREPVGV